ncbi:MAG: phosphatidylinositol kinase, partial [Bacteroidetes bacterium HGW-Bacteroidetes-10]
HMIDMFQITEAFDKYKSSMEKVGKAIDSYSSNTMLDKILYLELALFSFLTGNNDMHLKNFSMIESKSGWVLSPAYDLLNVSILIPKDDEELALTLSGKKKGLKWEHLAQLGKGMGLTDKQITGILARFKRESHLANGLLDKSFLSAGMIIKYKELMEKRFRQL